MISIHREQQQVCFLFFLMKTGLELKFPGASGGNKVLFHDSLDSVYVYFCVFHMCVQVHDIKIILY